MEKFNLGSSYNQKPEKILRFWHSFLGIAVAQNKFWLLSYTQLCTLNFYFLEHCILAETVISLRDIFDKIFSPNLRKKWKLFLGIYYHSSEKGGFYLGTCLVKCFSPMLQNFLYLWNMKTHILHSSFLSFFMPSPGFCRHRPKGKIIKLHKVGINYIFQNYGKSWSVSPYHFIKHMPLISKHCWK